MTRLPWPYDPAGQPPFIFLVPAAIAAAITRPELPELVRALGALRRGELGPREWLYITPGADARPPVIASPVTDDGGERLD